MSMKINLMGCTRIVFIFKKIVIKIPNFTVQWDHFLKGLLANMNEGDTWEWNSGQYEKGYSHLLCPVVWRSWGGWVLVMRRAVPLTIEDWEKLDDFTEWKEHFPGDLTISNFGYYEGRVVKIDYGQ